MRLGTRVVALGLAVGLALALLGCSGAEPANVKRYALRGIVMSADPQNSVLTIANEDIPGFMMAMTMPYPVKDVAAVRRAEPGDQITAQVLVAGADDYWLEDVQLSPPAPGSPPPSAAAPPSAEEEKAAQTVPMVNQDGKPLRLRDFRGDAVLITFIYTRCPMPTACPLLTSRFAQIDEQLAKDPAAYRKSHLISISLDPAYDTPPVLRRYGLAYLDDNAAGFSHWSFAVATPGGLRTLADAFGLDYTVVGNQIAHSMRTVLIAPDEKVAQAWDGSGWDPTQVEAALVAAATPGAK